MREIEFRGKRTDNGEWVSGFYVKSQDYYTQDVSNAILSADGNHYGFGEYTFETYNEIDVNTVGQYTGLTDKNGTKIFESDIIIGDIPELIGSQNLIGIVEYQESAFIVKIPNRKSWLIQKVGFCSFVNYRVIGNIHDNPELLEEV